MTRLKKLRAVYEEKRAIAAAAMAEQVKAGDAWREEKRRLRLIEQAEKNRGLGPCFCSEPGRWYYECKFVAQEQVGDYPTCKRHRRFAAFLMERKQREQLEDSKAAAAGRA